MRGLTYTSHEGVTIICPEGFSSSLEGLTLLLVMIVYVGIIYYVLNPELTLLNEVVNIVSIPQPL
jgi:hypothetical protein